MAMSMSASPAIDASRRTRVVVHVGPAQDPALVSNLALLLIQQRHELLQHGRLRLVLGLDQVVQLGMELGNRVLLPRNALRHIGQLLPCVRMGRGRGLCPFKRIELKFLVLGQANRSQRDLSRVGGAWRGTVTRSP